MALKVPPNAYNIKSILNSYSEEPKGFFIGRLVLALGISELIGIWTAIASFLAFTVLWSTHAMAAREWLAEFKSDEDTLRQIEKDFSFLAFIRGLVNTSILIAIYMNANKSYMFGSELVFAGLLAVTVYQNLGSLRLTISALAPQIVAVLGIGVWHSFVNQNPTFISAPLYYVIAILALAGGSLRDKVKIGKFVDESSKKARDLQKALAENKKDEELRQLIEKYAGIGFYRWNLHANKIELSQGAYKALGYEDPSEKIKTKEFLARLHSSDRQKISDYFKNPMQHRDIRDLEFRISCDGGGERQIRAYTMPILNDELEIVGVEGMVIDQTLSKTMLQKQESTKKLLDLALKNGKSFVLVRDSATNEAECYGDFSIFNFDKEINPNKVEDEILKHLNDHDAQKIMDAISDASYHTETITFEHQIKKSPFDIRHARATIYVDDDIWNRKGRLVSITTDITEDVNQRTLLAEALKDAESSNRAKSEFLANMSHEIRTPLNGVIAVTGLLAKSELNSSQKEMVEIIEASGSTLNHILNDVLDFARVESGMIQIEEIEFNLLEAVNVACALFQVKADEKGIGFETMVIGPANAKFKGDPTRIRQIISNLLSNAIKFTESGAVTVEIEVIEDQAEEKEYGCFVRIKDTGCGMSQEGLARLFSRFQQADGSITRTHGGTGLGLAISKSLANVMGGDVTAISQKDVGSVFTLYLPLKYIGSSNNDGNVQINNDIEEF